MMKLFSLRELLFIVAVLVAISWVSLANYQESLAKSRDSQRRAAVSKMAKALDDYFFDYDQYPLSNSNGQMIACGEPTRLEPCFGGQKVGTYFEIPNDPITDRRFYYEASSDGGRFRFWASLERPVKQDLIEGVNLPYCGRVLCNYGESGLDVNMAAPL